MSYFVHAVAFGAMTVITVILGASLLRPLDYGTTLLLAPAIYFLTEAIASAGQLIFSAHRPSVEIHLHPIVAPSLRGFWGRAWNVWVQDWLKDVALSLGGKRPMVRILVTFLVSGLFHEAMVNLPYWLVYGESYFGTMILYFVIQALALLGDKTIVRHAWAPLQRLYLWLVLVLPSPLFINRPLLTFLGVQNG